MKRASVTAVLFAIILFFSNYSSAGVRTESDAFISGGQATDAGITQTRVLGEVAEIDATAKRVVVKTDAGSVVTASFDEKTEFLRVPPGETSLDKALKTTLDEIAVGDKVYIRGRVSEDRQSVPAQKLIVMAKADIAKKREQENAEWKRRGISGVVSALNAQAKEITIQSAGREGVKPVIVVAPDAIKFRRYAADSVKFSDAKSSSFSELKVGDQLRALGDKSADGSKFTAEQVVSGSFRTVGGTVKATNPDTGELMVEMLGSNKALTIIVNKDSMLRKIPPQVAMMLAMRSQGASMPPGVQPSQTGSAMPPQPAGAARPTPQGAPNGAGAPTGPRMEGGGDLQDILERMPRLTIAEIKPGDVIAVSSTVGADPSKLTAITLVSGVDVVLATIQRLGASRRTPNVSTGLPSGVLDFGIGLP
jgi:hypothetical protein